MAMTADARHVQRERRRRGYRLVSAAFITALVWTVLSRSLDIAWAEVAEVVRAYPPRVLLIAALLAIGGQLAAASYDLISRRQLQVPLPAATVFVINFIAYIFSINLGALLGGWASRARLYARRGVAPPLIARVLPMAVVTNWSGFVLLGGLLLCFAAPLLPQTLPVPVAAQRGLGMLLLLIAAAYLLGCRPAGRLVGRPTLRMLQEILPRPELALLQFTLSAGSWLLMALCLWTVMPRGAGPVDVLAALLLASVAGAVLHVPGNLGVLEASLGHLLGGQAPAAQLLAAALVFRVVYFLLPFTLALSGFVILEWRAHRRDRAVARR